MSFWLYCWLSSQVHWPLQHNIKMCLLRTQKSTHIALLQLCNHSFVKNLKNPYNLFSAHTGLVVALECRSHVRGFFSSSFFLNYRCLLVTARLVQDTVGVHHIFAGIWSPFCSENRQSKVMSDRLTKTLSIGLLLSKCPRSPPVTKTRTQVDSLVYQTIH